MGMSASQMRYCLISGKKSDVEYQGQQVNQQRTTLATTSSTLNAQLLSLNVPTPPSTTDYTKVSYSLTDAGNSASGSTCTITGLTNIGGGKYNINYSYSTNGTKVNSGETNCSRVSVAATSTVPAHDDYYANGQKLTLYTAAAGTADAALKTAHDAANNGNYYVKDSSGSYKFFKDADITGLVAGAAAKTLTYKTPVFDTAITQTGKYSNASITWDGTRMASITTSSGDKISLTVGTTTDDKAYENAYNKYIYQKQEYESQTNKINAQSSIVQNQDKKLELKLKDLDTQQQALSTEMESVKKVVDKNIESSFKAFSA